MSSFFPVMSGTEVCACGVRAEVFFRKVRFPEKWVYFGIPLEGRLLKGREIWDG